MKRVFVDTLFWVASIISGDPWHQPATEAAQALGDVILVTTEEVLVEVLSACASRGEHWRRAAAGMVRETIANDGVIVLAQSNVTFLQGLDLYESRFDKAYSLVDCVSMNAMRVEGISEVLTNDHHFTQEGFTVLIHR